jgi:hypothetical protein
MVSFLVGLCASALAFCLLMKLKEHLLLVKSFILKVNYVLVLRVSMFVSFVNAIFILSLSLRSIAQFGRCRSTLLHITLLPAQACAVLAIIISSKSENTSILLNKVLLDAGCTRTIIKRDKLPDKIFESKKHINEVSWTTNAGKFVTKYEIPLQFSLPEFARSREINWSVAVDDTDFF